MYTTDFLLPTTDHRAKRFRKIIIFQKDYHGMHITLSKSRYLIGLRCPKLLWCHFHAPKLIPPIDASTQALFDQGHEVGNLAKERHPDGVEVEWEKGFEYTLKRTKELVQQKKTIFEASFAYKNAYCRVDILQPTDDGWDIIEVKSGTKVEEEHFHDVAFQRSCLEGNGIKVRRCHLMHINNEYVKHGKINPERIFTCEDITEEVTALLPNVEEHMQGMFAIIQSKTISQPKLGIECIDPKTCDVCLKDLPENNVTELYRLGNKAYLLLQQNIFLISEVPDDFILTDKQQIQKKCLLTQKPHLEKNALHDFLKQLHYPLYFLDFETINPAIPLFDGTRPYQHIPFQLSLHIVPKKGDKPEHVTFLADDAQDPRQAVLQTLKAIGSTGTVIAYNVAFEKSVLSDLLEAFPQEKWISSVIDRLNDLIIPFRNFWYYHPAQHGSCSIKAVLPALTGKSYAHLEVSKGDQAAREFLAMMYKGNQRAYGSWSKKSEKNSLENKDKNKLRAALLEYCKQDTEGMMEILKVLEKAIKEDYFV